MGIAQAGTAYGQQPTPGVGFAAPVAQGHGYGATMGPAVVNPNMKTKANIQPPGPVGPSAPPGNSNFPPAQAYYGNLAVRPQYGKFVKDIDLLSKMDPYVVFHVGEQHFQSHVCKSGGLEPVWNETLNIPINGQPELKVQVLDKDLITKDGLIGEAMIPVASLLQ